MRPGVSANSVQNSNSIQRVHVASIDDREIYGEGANEWVRKKGK